MSNITLPARTAVDLYVASGIVVGTQLKVINITTGDVRLSDTEDGLVDNHMVVKPYGQATNGVGESGAWATCTGGGAVTVSAELNGWKVGSIHPDGLYSGLRAMTVQDYTEANVKNGVQHEGSTLLTLGAGAVSDTIFLTGTLPVSLKGRTISYTGDGVAGEIYEAPTYTGGVDTEYQNANAINPVVGLSKILVGATVTVDGDLIFAPSYSIGNQSNQGKGATSSTLGSERVLKPDTAYLLRLTSLDDASQQVSSFLSWYEGELDLPR